MQISSIRVCLGFAFAHIPMNPGHGYDKFNAFPKAATRGAAEAMAARHSSITTVILEQSAIPNRKLYGKSFVCVLMQQRSVRHWQRFIVYNCMPASLFFCRSFEQKENEEKVGKTKGKKGKN